MPRRTKPDTFAARLRAAREAAGITQSEAASRAGIQVWTWSRWERQEHGISLEHAAAAAEAIGTTISELMQGYRSRTA